MSQQAIANSMIDVEIAPTCNFDCSDCLATSRLKDKRPRNNEINLVRLLEKDFPEGVGINFIGLGEPTLPRYQRDIYDVLSRRTDLNGFIQSNGSFPLIGDLGNLMEAGRLQIGVSYDLHHSRGNSRGLSVLQQGIQGEYVSGISIAVDSETKLEENSAKSILDRFPTLRKVLVEPLHNLSTNEPVVTYEAVRDFTSGLQEQFYDSGKEVAVFTAILPHLQHGRNKQFNEDAERDLQHVENEWYVDTQGVMYVLRRDVRSPESRTPRLLTNGLVLDETTFGWLGWDQVNQPGKIHVDYKTGKVTDKTNPEETIEINVRENLI